LVIAKHIGATLTERTSIVVDRSPSADLEGAVRVKTARRCLAHRTRGGLRLLRNPVLRQRRAAGIGSLLSLVIVAGCATPDIGSRPVVPDALRVPANQTLIREVQAVGVQIYQCAASKDDPARFEWTLKAPEAELRDRSNKLFGRHYAGPTWEAYDGSKVVGEVKARDPGPDPNAIPWLLLSSTSVSGQGVLSQTTSVQRISTSGGKAPAGGCNGTAVGEELRVPYKAKYYFYASGS
jgi:hypothetical protein